MGGWGWGEGGGEEGGRGGGNSVFLFNKKVVVPVAKVRIQFHRYLLSLYKVLEIVLRPRQIARLFKIWYPLLKKLQYTDQGGITIQNRISVPTAQV